MQAAAVTATKAVTKAQFISKLVPAQKPPKLGKKQIFLPNFVLTLLRTPNKAPKTATFQVPLNLNKLDLRDYLWNGYGVRVLGVRSFIQQQKLRQDKPGATRPTQRKWFRPRSIKKMIVELDRPFEFPPVPENFDPWDKEMQAEAKKDNDEWNDSLRPEAKEKPTKEREPIEQQAKEYLKGARKWMAYQEELSTHERDEWEDVGEEEEVETDVQVPRS